MDNQQINAILDEHPQLREQITHLLQVVVNAKDDIERADDAERQIIESTRLIGHNALQGWARATIQESE